MNAELKNVQITRNGMIEKLIEHRMEGWDESDTDEAIRCGRIGYEELSNQDLENLAGEWCLFTNDGEEVESWKITDPCPVKPTPEEINRELLEALKAIMNGQIGGQPDMDAERFRMARAAIAKAEGKPA